MRTRSGTAVVIAVVVLLSCGIWLTNYSARGARAKAHGASAGPDKTDVITQYGKLPLSFEPNLGQANSQVKFMSRSSGYALSLTPAEAILALGKPIDATAGAKFRRTPNASALSRTASQMLRV